MNKESENKSVNDTEIIGNQHQNPSKNQMISETTYQNQQKNENDDTNHNPIQKVEKNEKQQNHKISDKNKQIIQKKVQNTQSSIECQLLSMGFNKQLVEEALKINQDKDKAIQYIINTIQSQQKINQKINLKINQKVVQQKNKEEKVVKEDDEDFQDQEQDYKMVFLVRMDLKMGLGKIAAQVGHAALKAYKQMQAKIDGNYTNEVNFFEWMQGGGKKIVLKVDDLKQLQDTLKKAQQLKLNNCYIRDAGLTQVAFGSITVGAIGPAPSSQIDSITRQFKLL